MSNYYISDTHFAHDNIIRYCSRPFETADQMNRVMMGNILDVVLAGHRLIHAGDLCYGRGSDSWLLQQDELPGREQHVIVAGNHDRGLKGGRSREAYQRWFGQIVGRYQTWRENYYIVSDLVGGRHAQVLVSHLPQSDLRGCTYNLYGHVHNNPMDDSERWAYGSKRHFNICVEMQDYRPKTLSEIVS